MPLANISGPGSRLYVSPPEAPVNGSILFVSNAESDNEYGRIATVPANFGAGEFAITFWLQLTTGTASAFTSGTSQERTDWDTTDTAPYDASDWWFRGNFCMDGHNNNGSAFYDGTLSLQLVDSGKPRWLFGDGAAANARTGDLHAVQDTSLSSLRDGAWHKLGFRRINDGGTGSVLESWLDGAIIATETSSARTNMYTAYWDDFAAQAAAQRGFFFGGEKQACVGVFTQYADYKGRLAEVAFWDAPSDSIMESLDPVEDSDTGLLDVIRFIEQAGTTAEGANGTTMTLNEGDGGQAVAWSANHPFE
jgi:hypothetical protein